MLPAAVHVSLVKIIAFQLILSAVGCRYVGGSRERDIVGRPINSVSARVVFLLKHDVVHCEIDRRCWRILRLAIKPTPAVSVTVAAAVETVKVIVEHVSRAMILAQLTIIVEAV